jgi:hypothetical protein
MSRWGRNALWCSGLQSHPSPHRNGSRYSTGLVWKTCNSMAERLQEVVDSLDGASLKVALQAVGCRAWTPVQLPRKVSDD